EGLRGRGLQDDNSTLTEFPLIGESDGLGVGGGSRVLRVLHRWILDAPPLVFFFVVYLLTTHAGAATLLLSSVARSWYVYLTGAQLPPLTLGNVVYDLLLLNVAPVLLVVGWWSSGRWMRRWFPLRGSDEGRGSRLTSDTR